MDEVSRPLTFFVPRSHLVDFVDPAMNSDPITNNDSRSVRPFLDKMLGVVAGTFSKTLERRWTKTEY